MKLKWKELEKYKDTEFFLVCVHFGEAIIDNLVNSDDFFCIENNLYWAITSKVSHTGRGLITSFVSSDLMFRGYDCETGVHSYSKETELEALVNPLILENGVYSYIKIDRKSGIVTVKSDPFGISPLYYRKVNGLTLFSSHPVLLLMDDDQPDLLAWTSLLQNGYILGDYSFYKNIKRFSAGSQLTVSKKTAECIRWFHLDLLPKGDKSVDDAAFVNVEEAYQTAIENSLKINPGSLVLPFSSGYDSRRFFSTLHSKNVVFTAVTCQTVHYKNGKTLDIDSYFAPKIANAFGIKSVLLAAKERAAARDAVLRRISLIGTECFMHDWAMPLMKWLTEKPSSAVFDGLGGDVFGNSGFEIEGLHQSPETDTALILQNEVKVHVLSNLAKIFPSLTEYAEEVKSELSKYPNTLNRAEFFFLQSRTRRAVGPWLTMMHPPGMVAVFPYFDLNFVRETLRYSPSDKYKHFLQKECLKRFHKKYYDFEGSRNIGLEASCLETNDILADELNLLLYSDTRLVLAAMKYLNMRNRLLLIASFFIKPLRRKRSWLFRNLLVLVKSNLSNKPVISLI